ncbi:MAG: hypothetical protein A3I05_02150 [Deltaproteobacteria bacterium RIFCSPLOWO2_02_FULL_44_10]|nr:MAG: hypothetical protein A3I05_02150 [Deltaproteobacteria bacterium RIFCSPLOWO2_02_FULL_44_10]
MDSFTFKIFFIFFFLFTSDAFACPVCFSAKGDSLHAFYLSTVLLSFLPLGMIGGFFLWYRRQMKENKISS